PTGRGKTTTLYTALHLLNDPGHVIMTIEDPVEDQIRGINQIEISPKSGLTFARGRRTILRSDPAARGGAGPSAEGLAAMGLLEQKGKVYLHRSSGCGRCAGSGFRGRVALYEVMPVTGELRSLVGASTDEIFEAAVRTGMTTLRQDGLRLCLEGVSSLGEIRRVTG